MSTHDENHERILEAAFTETIREEDEAALLQLEETCTTCRERIETLRRAREAMEREGASVREELTEACEQRTRSDEQAVAATIHAELDYSSATTGAIGPATGRSTTPFRNALPWVLAAAAVIVALILAFGDDKPTDDPLMMGNGIEILGPEGDAVDFTLFDWNGPAAASYRVRVFALDSGPDAEPVVESRVLDESQWTPGTSALSSMPDRIRWELQVFEAGGTELRFTERVDSARRR